MTTEESALWFSDYNRAKREKKLAPPLFDFLRPLPPTCKDCGYPFGDVLRRYRLKTVDCPKHWPAHWNYHEEKAYEEACSRIWGEKPNE